MENVPWSQLLNPYLAGELAAPELAEAVQEVARLSLIKLENGQVSLQHGLAKDDSNTVVGYLIDSNFFIETQTEIDDAFTILDHFNQRNRQLFRWCISDQLHHAMEPDAVTAYHTG